MKIVPLPQSILQIIKQSLKNEISIKFDTVEIVETTDTELRLKISDYCLDESFDVQYVDIKYALDKKLAKYFETCEIEAYYSGEILEEVCSDIKIPTLYLVLKRERILK